MRTIIELDATEARELLRQLKAAEVHTSTLRKLRVCVEDHQVKFKVNEWSWSPGVGQLDPMCQEALQRDLEALKPENRIDDRHQSYIDAVHEDEQGYYNGPLHQEHEVVQSDIDHIDELRSR